MATANITPTALSGGILYANAVPLTPAEADLNGGSGAQVTTPVPIVEGQTVVAVVVLTWSGRATGAGTLVVLQTDLGDGNWVDVAWCFWNGVQGSAKFVLCAGGLGAMNNAFAASRQSSSMPASQANGSNAVPLGGRIRFTGFTTMSGGSSNVAGTPTSIAATITYKVSNPT